ncbi:MAG: type IA DNA topoisomerase [Nitrososphaerota archaeon]
MPNYVVVAEKKSVAQALYRVLKRRDSGVFVTSISGHLMDCDLVEKYSRWRLSDLPALFKSENTRLVVSDRYSYRRVMEVFSRLREGLLVVATDNDHEGELIGYELVTVFKGVCGEGAEYRRMRFNSLEEDEITRAWRNLEPDLNWGWVYKAQLRRSFDLLTGAAFTRLLTLSARRRMRNVGVISWGPVQSPCLKFLVDREKEIRGFKPRKFWYVTAKLKFGGEVFRAGSGVVWDRIQAEGLIQRVSSARLGEVQGYEEERVRIARPLPARTDDSLRDLVKVTGKSSYSLMGIMERLYQLGCLSYPRTETNKYPEGFDFNKRLKILMGSEILAGVSLRGEPRPRNGRLSDGSHPPIYPTGLYAGGGIERVVWEYFARRFLANAFAEDALAVRQRAVVRVNGVELMAEGRYMEEVGFYRLFPYFKPREEPIPRLAIGEVVEVVEARLVEDETKPPPRLTESDLLRMMESYELGTDATRPLYPTLLIQRGFIVRHQRRLKPTSLGEALVSTLAQVDERLVTPETRRIVEEFMRSVERGESQLEEALRKALDLYRPLLESCLAQVDRIGERLTTQTAESRR